MRVSNSLEPDQARPFVGPDLVPNCLQMLTEDTSRQRVNPYSSIHKCKRGQNLINVDNVDNDASRQFT